MNDKDVSLTRVGKASRVSPPGRLVPSPGAAAWAAAALSPARRQIPGLVNRFGEGVSCHY